jgi:membrane fusion protein (multidrug efflux system)
MLKKFTLALGGFVIIALLLGGKKAAQVKQMMSMPHDQPVPAVATYTSRAVDWVPTFHAVGSLAPVAGTMLSADADGVLKTLHVDNGAKVKAGDLIAELDTSVEQAQLESAQAREELAQVQSKRAKELIAGHSMSQADADAISAQLDQARADVAALQAQIAKKQVRAPFSGRVGIRAVNPGQFIARGAPIISLQQLDHVYVNFYVPQRELPLLQAGHAVDVAIDAFPDKTFPAEITAIDSQVDSQTRNIAVQATLPNPDEALRPGMFVHVNVQLGASQHLVVVPATAIAYASYGNSVYIIEKSKDKDGHEHLTARQQFVTLGETRGDLIAIANGLEAGQVVASAGVFKLRNGVPVQINNEVQPSAQEHPTPANS